MITRRRFLETGVAATAAIAARDLLPEVLAAPMAANSELKALAEVALNEARKLGAIYADIRIC